MRDHCHITGEYRVAAHNTCKLKLQLNPITTPHKAGALQTPVFSSSPPLASPCGGHTAYLFQNHQAPRYGWRLMLFREQVALTALLDRPLQLRRNFHGIFAPYQTLFDQLLRNAVAQPFLRNKRLASPGRYSQNALSEIKGCTIDRSANVKFRLMRLPHFH